MYSNTHQVDCFPANTMSMQGSDMTQTKQEPPLYFPQEFKEHLEDLVFEILKEKPRDPLEYAFKFFSKRLKSREETPITKTEIDEMETKTVNLLPKHVSRSVHTLEHDYQAENTDTQSTRTSGNMSETQAATVIQAYFRGYNVRKNWWKKRYLKTSLYYHDHLSVRRDLDSPRGSFSFCWPEENILAITNYDSEESVDNN